MEFTLLLTIVRCARVARFVRSRTMGNASNKIKWYWILHQSKYFNPLFYWKKIRKQRRQAHLISLGVTGDDSTSFVKNANREDKRTSWGVLHIGILAAVRAQAEAEAREAEEAKRSSLRLWNSIKRSLMSMGFMDNERLIAFRHEAAIKIQRVWRAHVRFENTASNDGGSNFGDGVLANDSDHAANPLDRVLRKRSALKAFAQLNARTGGKLDRNDIKASRFPSRNEHLPESRFQSQSGKGRNSQVGSDMRELTGQRVALGVLLTLVFTVVFTYTESNSTCPTTMVVLHGQTNNSQFQMDALYAARNTSTPELYMFEPANGDPISFPPLRELREREKLRVTVTDESDQMSVGWFVFREERVQSAWTEIVATVFIILVWCFGVTAFAGPVMSLVVIPIERMVRLLGMLMLDPLGYQSTARFKKFLVEEDALIKNTRWTKEVLKGMETSFLMSTILRIGSLMKVGFGSAGVEIIRNNLQKGQSKNMLILNSQGSTVSCIFLFCDIRQFTDATECLQEEVFVFTNRIAAVIHSICHSYGGAANKNVGDAFLLSWSLEDTESTRMPGGNRSPEAGAPLKAKSNQADKALLSVIKICISLHYDKYYLDPLSEAAKKRLHTKLKNRSPVVRMGFGLHAGKAVQGAIGSQRKIDATYVSEAVERAEFLESSTKQYGLEMLMSGSFHRLLHPNTRRRCRKVDQILIQDDDDDDYDEDEYDDELKGELMELFTFDMDVDAIHRPLPKAKRLDIDAMSDAGSIAGMPGERKGIRRLQSLKVRNRRRSMSTSIRTSALNGSEELLFTTGPNTNLGGDTNTMGSPSVGGASVSSVHSLDESNNPNVQGPPELVLPTGPALYSHNVWQSPDMKRIRDKFVQGLFFQKYNAGLQAFYNKDWDTAQQCFKILIENFDDGPSNYFMKQIKKHNGVPPKDFLEYGLA
jgi:class 3 adenylate cyclase